MAGALDETTGELRLDDPAVGIGPRTSKRVLADSDAASQFERASDSVWRLRTTIEGHSFVVSLHWARDDLTRIGLLPTEPEIAGTGWDDYPIEELRDWNDAWVDAHAPTGKRTERDAPARPYGAVERKLRWGKVTSHCHPQDMIADISIIYR